MRDDSHTSVGETTGTSAGKALTKDEQSLNNFGIDLQGIALNFDLKREPELQDTGHIFNVSAPFTHKCVSCCVYDVTMIKQEAKGWFVVNEYHKDQFGHIKKQLERTGK